MDRDDLRSCRPPRGIVVVTSNVRVVCVVTATNTTGGLVEEEMKDSTFMNSDARTRPPTLI